jgi:trehalose synthase
MFDLVPVPQLSLASYEPFAGAEEVEVIRRLAEPLRDARVLHINATAYGGGVAELLPTLCGLMLDLGIAAEWRVVPGDEAFFGVTKALHNALQGATIDIDPTMRDIYQAASARFAAAFEGDYDYVVVHDPQPAALRYLAPTAPGRWIWRCHIDLTAADEGAWELMRPLVEAYDAAIFTLPDYVKPDLRLGTIAYIPPSIDPLSPKNAPMELGHAHDVVRRFGVDPHRPILVQVSRFDPWKDPRGVIDAYRAVKREIPGVQLALVGSMATDDPEGWRIYQDVLRYGGVDDDLFFFTNLDGVHAPEVNAFQTAAHVVLQKSLREGFGLTVAEALWKGVPVVGGRVGGIPMQIGEDACGRLVDNVDGATSATLELLRDEELRTRLGIAGRERVRRHFLSTRNVRNYLSLFGALSAGDPSLVPAGIADD